MKKGLLAMFLTACLLVGCLPLAASAEETELPKLARPTNLEWGKEYANDGSSYMEKPGVASWKIDGLHQNWVYIKFYSAGTSESLGGNTLYISSDENSFFDSDNYFYLLDVPSGNYYFTVQTLGDGTNYASSDIVTSPTWSYTRPDRKLDIIFSNLTWNWPSYSSECSNTEGMWGYHTDVYYSPSADGEKTRIGGSYLEAYSSLCDADLAENIIQRHGSGYYYFRFRAISDDITQFCNSEWSDFSSAYNLNDITQTVNGNLSDIISSGNADGAEIRQAVQDVGTDDLKTALLADKGEADGTADMLSKLEAKTGTTVTVAAEEGFSKIDNTGVSIVGAALNTLEQDVSEITLKLREPERENVIPTQYNNTVAIQFAMDLDGVAQPEELAVPVKITLPVPSSINPEFLAILHYGLNGEVKETIKPYVFQESGQHYASFVLTSFSDFVMTEEKEEEPGPTPPSPSGPAVPCATLEEAILTQAKAYGLLTYADGIDTTGNLTRLEMTQLIAGLVGVQINTTADVTLDFPDCNDLNKADRAVINWAVTEGLMSGRPANGSVESDELVFAPEATITRAEISYILTRLLSVPGNAEYKKHFADVADYTWYAEAVNRLSEQGFFTTEGENFFPQVKATRQDALRWLVAAYEYKNSQAVSMVTILATASVKTSEKTTLTPAIAPAINGPAYVWTSSDPSVATVENGVVTGVTAGTAEITVQLANGNSAACTVTVSGSSAPEIPSEPSGGGSSTPSIADPVITENPDGSTTTTETAPDGTVTATTTWEDGGKAVAVKTPEGEKTITVTTANGEKAADVKLPAKPAAGKEFEDVKSGSWYESAVETATGYGLFNGTTETTFSPDDGMTRAMLATVLHNLSGKPEYGTEENTFADVTVNAWYEDPVDWAYKMGVTSGTSGTEFSPNHDITREQLVTMLYRYAGKIGAGSTNRKDIANFPDGGSVAGFAKDAMEWAVAEGLLSGRAQGGKSYIAPQGTATRAEVAAVLARFVEYLKK